MAGTSTTGQTQMAMANTPLQPVPLPLEWWMASSQQTPELLAKEPQIPGNVHKDKNHTTPQLPTYNNNKTHNILYCHDRIWPHHGTEYDSRLEGTLSKPPRGHKMGFQTQRYPWDWPETLVHKPLTAVSDGSYKDTQGMAAWVVYTDSAPKMAISLHVLTTPGHATSQSSYCSELAGIYGIITTIAVVSKFYQINHGTVIVICDGKSTLKCCFKQQVCNPTEKYFNIIHAIWTMMWETSLQWQWEHVRSHQDATAIANLDKVRWNDAMDTAAKPHWETIQHHPEIPVLVFRGELWRLWVGQQKISLNAKWHLLKHICGQAAKKYWKSKKDFYTDPNLVDWDSIEAAMTDMTIIQKKWTSKFVTGFCATGKKMLQMQQWESAACPNAEKCLKPQCIYSSASNHCLRWDGPLT